MSADYDLRHKISGYVSPLLTSQTSRTFCLFRATSSSTSSRVKHVCKLFKCDSIKLFVTIIAVYAVMSRRLTLQIQVRCKIPAHLMQYWSALACVHVMRCMVRSTFWWHFLFCFNVFVAKNKFQSIFCSTKSSLVCVLTAKYSILSTFVSPR